MKTSKLSGRVLGMLMLAFVLILTACSNGNKENKESAASGSPTSSAASGDKKVIKVGYSGEAPTQEYMHQVIADASAKLSNIEIQEVLYPTYADLLNKLPMEIASNTAPDVIWWSNENAPEYMDNGAVEPLDELLADAGIKMDEFLPGLVKSWTYQDKLYGIPLTAQNSAMAFNNDLLQKAGVSEIPQSMEEVRTAALAVKEKTGDNGILINLDPFHITQYILAFGGGWNYGKTINSAQNVEGLQFLADLFSKDKVAVTSKDLGLGWDGEAFGKGNVAMSTGGPWYIGYLQSSAPDLKYQLAPVPAKEKGKSIMVTYGGGYSILKKAEDKQAAIQVIAELTNDSAFDKMVNSSLGFIPAKQKFMDAYVKQVPQFAPLQQAFENGVGFDYPIKMKQFSDELIAGFENMIYRGNGITSQQLLDSLQEKYGTQ